MTKLPFLISVPHAGVRIPEEVRDLCILTPDEVADDSDDGASEIYAFNQKVHHFLISDIARAVIDLNRKTDDFSIDGVVKTHTCHMRKVYGRQPEPRLVQTLLNRFYHPYHKRLADIITHGKPRPVIGFDCHTMLEFSPQVSETPGIKRPRVCLSTGDGTCPEKWFERLYGCFVDMFGDHVAINDPFKGGYIIRNHSKHLPWVQIELSREPFMDNREKGERVFNALTSWFDWYQMTMC